METTYTIPYYLTVGLVITVRGPDGALHHIPAIIEEIGEAGLEGLVENFLKAAAARDLVPPTEAEYAAWARGQAQAHLQEYAIAAMTEHRERADLTEHDKVLARHIAKNPKGDA